MNKVLFLSLVAVAAVGLSSCADRDDEPVDPSYGQVPPPPPPAGAEPYACSPGSAQGGGAHAPQGQGNSVGYNPSIGNNRTTAVANNTITEGSTVVCSGQYQPVKPSEKINSDQYQMKYVYCLKSAPAGDINYCNGQYRDVERNIIVNCVE